MLMTYISIRNVRFCVFVSEQDAAHLYSSSLRVLTTAPGIHAGKTNQVSLRRFVKSAG